MFRYFTMFVSMLIVVFITGCNNSGGVDTNGPEQVESQGLDDVLDETGDETGSQDGSGYYGREHDEHNCWRHDSSVTSPPTSLAAWAVHADAVLIGTVAEIAGYSEPFLGIGRPGDSWVFGTDEDDVCLHVRHYGARVTLTDVETLYGAQQESEVVIHLGAGILSSPYVRHLLVDEDGGFAGWKPRFTPPPEYEDVYNELEFIKLDERMGINLMCDDYWGYCGNWGRPLFRFDDSGRVRFFPNDWPATWDFCDPRPRGAKGLTLEELRQTLANLIPPADDDPDLVRLQQVDPRRTLDDPEMQANVIRSRLIRYWAAHCDMDPDRPRGGCHDMPAEMECPDEHYVCWDGGAWHGYCVELCGSDDDCDSGWVCAPEGVCTRPCSDDGTCPMGPVPDSTCIEGFCRPEPGH